MYTYVYKFLTAHNTIIHSKQVDWDMDAPLGQMLESIDLAKESGKPTSARLAIDDVHIDSVVAAEPCIEGGTSDKLPMAKLPSKARHSTSRRMGMCTPRPMLPIE